MVGLEARPFEDLFESSFDLMCIGDVSHLTHVNKTFISSLGYTNQDQVIGLPYECFIHVDDLAKFLSTINNPTVAEHQLELRMVSSKGTVITVNWNFRLNLIKGEFCGAGRDVSEKKVIETQLGRYVIDLKKSKDEAVQFAYVASHDLQEPLRTIANYAGFIKEDYGHLLPFEGNEYLTYILDAAKTGRTLVSDLLQLSRVGRDNHFDHVDMNKLVDEVVVGLEFNVRDTKATISRSELPPVWGDSHMLRLLVHNLLSNALKFRKDGESPHVLVNGEALPDKWHFWVKDNGIGLDPKYAEQVFAIFKRIDRSRSGTGIGLAICRKVLDMHQGDIWIESSPGAGATVHFSLPASTDASRTKRKEHPSDRGPSSGRSHRTKSIEPLSDTDEAIRGEGRSGSVHVLATSGALRDRPSTRPDSGGSEPTKDERFRGR